jgi:hypothetical protein
VFFSRTRLNASSQRGVQAVVTLGNRASRAASMALAPPPDSDTAMTRLRHVQQLEASLLKEKVK